MSDRPLWRLVAGKKTGPYPPGKLRPLVKDGRIGPTDRFSYDGEVWGTVPEFPELLRDPPPPVAAPVAAAAVPSAALSQESFVTGLDEEGSGTWRDDFDTPSNSGGVGEDDESSEQLMRVVYWVMGVGGGLIALLILLTLFTLRVDTSSGVSAPTHAASVTSGPPGATGLGESESISTPVDSGTKQLVNPRPPSGTSVAGAVAAEPPAGSQVPLAVNPGESTEEPGAPSPIDGKPAGGEDGDVPAVAPAPDVQRSPTE